MSGRNAEIVELVLLTQWPAAGSEDTELGVNMEPAAGHKADTADAPSGD